MCRSVQAGGLYGRLIGQRDERRGGFIDGQWLRSYGSCSTSREEDGRCGCENQNDFTRLHMIHINQIDIFIT